jgi:hypothetical protein
VFIVGSPFRAWSMSAALLPLLTLAACGGSSPAPAPGTPASPVDPSTAGSISGKVVLDGTPPPATMIRLDGDPTCLALNGGRERATEHLVVGEQNALQNVFVYVKDGLETMAFPAPTEPIVLDQQKCRYVPRVLGVQVGQPLVIRNSDPLLHNVRADGDINRPFNLGQPVQGIAMTRTFATREVMVPFKCDVHAWMAAYVGVLEHPFHGVTGANGTFSLDGLPPGTYTIEAWHEKLGAAVQQVTVGVRESKNVSFAFKI